MTYPTDTRLFINSTGYAHLLSRARFVYSAELDRTPLPTKKATPPVFTFEKMLHYIAGFDGSWSDCLRETDKSF